ncbi:unnamed protein product, partial [Cylicostephanus goldi]
ATIVDNPDFDPAIYADKLDHALKASDKDAIVKLLTSISNNQRQMVSYAWTKGLGTDEAVLIEILCSRTPDQLTAIRAAYQNEYKTPLEKDIADDTSGEFKDLLVALATGSKDNGRETNDEQAKEGKLAGKGAQSHLFTILTSQNQYQLKKVFDEFARLSGATIEKAIEKEFSGDVQKS